MILHYGYRSSLDKKLFWYRKTWPEDFILRRSSDMDQNEMIFIKNTHVLSHLKICTMQKKRMTEKLPEKW